jgi:hypothetical protein
MQLQHQQLQVTPQGVLSPITAACYHLLLHCLRLSAVLHLPACTFSGLLTLLCCTCLPARSSFPHSLQQQASAPRSR